MSERNLTQVKGIANARYVRLRPLKEKEQTDGIYLSLSQGDTLTGIYSGNEEGNFGKKNYTIESADGKSIPVVISAAGNLAARMSQVPVGAYVEITYDGKTAIKSGPYKGKEANNFSVAYEKV